MKRYSRYIKHLVAALALTCVSSVATASPVPEPAPAAQSLASSQPQVRVLPGQVEITVSGDDDCDVTIYALTGQVVKSFTAHPGATVVDLPKGYYIVKCDRISCRVVVK